MKVTMVGTGYVGLVAGACFAESGNDVICVDIDEKKVEMLKNGGIPIYEPGLDTIVQRNIEKKRISFTTSLQEGVEKSDIIFIAVGTPQDEDGSADLSHVLAVAEGIGKHMNGKKVIVDKSTVPVGTAEKVRKKVSEFTSHEFEVVSNPEFLKEGAAVDDFLKPDRVVIGVESDWAREMMDHLYSPFMKTNNRIIFMDVVSAEMTKYAANAMLATRISFMNEIAKLCEKSGANINDVRKGIGTDNRIGMGFLFAGCGYGGSCFPKDVQALIRTAQEFDVDLKIVAATEAVNEDQKHLMVEKVLAHYGEGGVSGKTFALWGLAFKPRTDDTREAPALVISKRLIDAGAKVQAYDPEGVETFQWRFGDNPNITYTNTDYDALKGADALIICTEWNEFRNPDFERIKGDLKEPLIFDGRNIYSLDEMKEQGFTYYSIGRPNILA